MNYRQWKKSRKKVGWKFYKDRQTPNITASTEHIYSIQKCRYQRVGDVVTVFGVGVIKPRDIIMGLP